MLAIPPDMLATGLALLTAHLCADFLLQSGRMVANKHNPMVFPTHIVIVAMANVVALGGGWELAIGLALVHALIDAIKTYGLTENARNSLAAFFADQAAHLVSIALAAFLIPSAYATGIWAEFDLRQEYILISGAILATLAGGPAVGLLMQEFDYVPPEGLAGAGRMIGLLERSMIFLMVMVGEPAGIGFLIAAKSVLRFDAAKENSSAEYVIIGTLASFGWALLAGTLTQGALSQLGG